MNLADYRITIPKLRGVKWNRLHAALACAVLSTSIVSAQRAVRSASAEKPAHAKSGVANARAAHDARSIINGVVVNNDRLPMRNASVRLRNLDSGAVEQTSTSNERGEFSFVVRPEVHYVVEIADHAGRVIAVGDVIRANAGEVAGTVVSLPSRLPALAGVFGDTASSVISAATSTGLTVVDPTLPKVSPRK